MGEGNCPLKEGGLKDVLLIDNGCPRDKKKHENEIWKMTIEKRASQLERGNPKVKIQRQFGT
jgi:hypothetical protein